MKTHSLNTHSLNTQTLEQFVRNVTFTLAAAAMVVIGGISLAGCEFMDDDNPHAGVRGFTYCGEDFADDVYCSPGQWCENQTFNDCEIGCLSDVNCASNQACMIDTPGQPGTCANLYNSSRGLESADAGASVDVGVAFETR
ncbi:MAG: hypothetical protein ACI81R_002711 [Bradymonadia bacterium]|jgi:hypothetical protein